MVNLGSFLNEYAANSHVLSVWLVAVLIGLPVFAFFYNRFIDRLKGKEHTSLYVAFGNLVTIFGGGADLVEGSDSVPVPVCIGRPADDPGGISPHREA